MFLIKFQTWDWQISSGVKFQHWKVFSPKALRIWEKFWNSFGQRDWTFSKFNLLSTISQQWSFSASRRTYHRCNKKSLLTPLKRSIVWNFFRAHLNCGKNEFLYHNNKEPLNRLRISSFILLNFEGEKTKKRKKFSQVSWELQGKKSFLVFAGERRKKNARGRYETGRRRAEMIINKTRSTE